MFKDSILKLARSHRMTLPYYASLLAALTLPQSAMAVELPPPAQRVPAKTEIDPGPFEATEASLKQRKLAGEKMQEKLMGQLSPEGKDKAIEAMLKGHGKH